MDATKIIKQREAGAVSRCHIIPHHGDYTVAAHSYNAAMLLLTLHPDPPLYLVRHVMAHDLHERYAGDMPASVKWYHPVLDQMYTIVGDKINKVEGWCQKTLTEEEVKWVRAVDYVELLMWSDDQLALGNKHVRQLHDNVIDWLYQSRENIPEPVWVFLSQYRWRRTPEAFYDPTLPENKNEPE